MDFREEFKSLLDRLTTSRDSINKCSKFAIAYSTFSDEIFEIILQFFSKKSSKCTEYLYLLDSICQNAKSKGAPEYISLIKKNIKTVAKKFVRYSKDNQKAGKTLEKILKIWSEKSLIAKDDETEITSKINSGELLSEANKNKTPPELPVVDFQQEIENYRREAKRLRWESRRRPVDDYEFREFLETWQSMDSIKIRRYVPKIDMKALNDLVHLRHRFNSPTSPTSCLSSPATSTPSPCTPYSPSISSTYSSKRNVSETMNHSERILLKPPRFLSFSTEEKTPNQKVMYSPESPTSPPEFFENIQGYLFPVLRSSALSNRPQVVIWNLDETLFSLNSLPFQACMRSDEVESHVFHSVHLMKDIIQDFANRQLFFKQLKQFDLIKSDCFRFYDDGRDLEFYDFQSDNLTVLEEFSDVVKLSYRLRIVSNTYNKRTDYSSVSSLSEEEMKALLQKLDVYSNNWLTRSFKLLQDLRSQQNFVNIVVSSDDLVQTIAKLILFGLNSFIPIENVFGSFAIGKRWCFRKIREQFEDCNIWVVGHDPEEQLCAYEENMQFFQIFDSDDISRLNERLLKKKLQQSN